MTTTDTTHDRTPRLVEGSGEVEIVPVENGETYSSRHTRANGIDRHGLYGLKQYHGWGGKTTSVSFSGSARRLLENRTIALAKERHPHGIMLFAFSHSTVIQIDRKLEARALYCEITDLLQGRSITARQRKSLHRIRDAIVDHAENPDLSGGWSAIDPWDPTEPVTTDDPILVRAKDNADPDTPRSGPTMGFRIEQVDLTDERPAGL